MTAARSVAKDGPPPLRGGLLTVLGFLSMAGSLSTDLYLPSFPDIARDFEVGASTVQLTLTAYLIGSAFGQLLLGAVSDALGRRRTLIVALSVFAACGYLAVLSPSIGILILLRAVQGFAGSAGTVLSRAVVTDLTDHERAVRAFSLLWVMIALGPALASPLGAWLTNVGGWRAALLGLAAASTLMLVAAIVFVPESLPREQRHPFTVPALARNVGALLRNPVYLGFALAFACGYAALITYIGSSSFLVQGVLDAGPVVFALTFSFTSVAVMVGAWLTGRTVRRLGPFATLRLAQVLAVLSAAAGVLLALTGTLTMVTYLVMVAGFAIGSGGIMSSASALALGEARSVAGAGSAVMGFVQFLLGAAASPLGGIAGPETAVPATVTMTVFAVLSFAAAAFARARAVR